MDFGLLHFTRPLWLLALLPACLLAVVGWRLRTATVEWHEVLDPIVRDHLLERRGVSRLPLLLPPIGWLLAILALAGPAWQQLPQPVLQKQDSLVLVLDLSQSMYARDIVPSRLERARNKLQDVLVERKEGLTGLVAYAGDAFTIAPMTDDAGTLQSLVRSLAPAIMPTQGSNPRAALEEAAALLERSGFKGGQLLLVTDGIKRESITDLAELARSHRLHLSILGIGTPAGAPIRLPGGNFLQRDGQPVIARLDTAPLEELAQAVDGHYRNLHLDDSDIRDLLAGASAAEILVEETERTSDLWREEGPWLALALLPIALLSFRRGWLLTIMLLPFLGAAGQAKALEWGDLWQRADQQAAAALERGDVKDAAALFEDSDWRGAALYEAGDYEEALLSWPAGRDIRTDYNRGNALARAGRLSAALKAYDAVLEVEPGMEDAAFNREVVKSLIDRLQQQGSPQGQSSGEEGESGGEQQNAGAGQQRSSGEGEQNSAGENGEEGQQQAGQDGQEGSAEEEEEYLQKVARQEEEQEAEGGKQATAETGEQGEEEEGAEQAAKGEKEEQGEESVGSSEKEKGENDGDAPGETEALTQTELPQGEDSQAKDVWLRQVHDDPARLLRNKLKYQHIRRQQRGESRENRREAW